MYYEIMSGMRPLQVVTFTNVGGKSGGWVRGMVLVGDGSVNRSSSKIV